MADIVFRGNLNAANWPLISSQQGRTVLVGQLDTNASKFNSFGGRDLDRDIGIPQALFMQNVVPTQEGFASVSYSSAIKAAIPAVTHFDRAFSIRDAEGRRGVFVPAGGAAYVYNAVQAAWYRFNLFVADEIGTTTVVTTAFVQGRQFICFQSYGLYEYNFVANTLTNVPMTGLSNTAVTGIAASSGYLLAFGGQDNLYWSSLTNPVDFVTSLVTGAGSGTVLDLRGQQTAYLPITNGFIVYSTANAVQATYTGNLQIPWNMKEIPGSGGVIHAEHVTFEENLHYHYAWTSNGLLKVEKSVAANAYPQVTDFLTSQIFEDFDYAANTLTAEKLTANLSVKLTHVGNRYLIVSYGKTGYTHALIYDETLERWGKLKIEHLDCFPWNSPNLFGVITYQMMLAANTMYEDLLHTSYADLLSQQKLVTQARRDIAFLQKDGTVVLLDFSFAPTDSEGVLILGKFQLARNSDFTLHKVELESTPMTTEGSNFEHYWWTSYNGKTLASLQTSPVLVEEAENLRVYEGRVTGINHSLVIKGVFAMCSIQISGIQAGDR